MWLSKNRATTILTNKKVMKNYLRKDGFYKKGKDTYLKFRFYKEEENKVSVYRTYKLKLGSFNLGEFRYKLIPHADNIVL